MLQNTPIDRWENGEQSESEQRKERVRESEAGERGRDTIVLFIIDPSSLLF